MTTKKPKNSFASERIQRLTDAALACEYGIGYLTDTLAKILPADLVVLGGRTGAGKTELATQIAKHNAQQGKKVCYIALEGDRFELEQRIKYNKISKIYYENPSKYGGGYLNFRDWKLTTFDDKLKEIDSEITDLVAEECEELEIIYPSVTEFFRDDLELMWEELSESFDLIIIDHLHYIDFEESNEHIGVKRNVSKIRGLINKYRVPAILISHLRKTAYANKSITPQIEELHGSSEISKQANHVISFSRCYEIGDHEFEKPMTAFEILKTRWAEGVGYIGVTNFDFKTKKYDDPYALYRIKDRFCTKAKPVKISRAPHWANRMVEAE